MKKFLAFWVLFLAVSTFTFAQIPTPEIKVHVDASGAPDGTYYVSFYKTTSCNDTGTIDVTYYLSYKGKRVSDYYYMSFCVSSPHGKNSVAWPDEVPKGYEKYVTVQLGKEKEKKDRRDDD
jgi:hypothetical protein